MKNNGQLSLHLGDAPRKRGAATDPLQSDTLFFALLPDPEIASLGVRLAGDMRRQYGFRTKPRPWDLFHITLYHLQSYDGLRESRHEVAFAAMQAASMIRSRTFQVIFDQAVSFGKDDNRPLVLWRKDGNAEVKALHRELHDAMQLTGFANEREKKFEPHMTLLYRGHHIPEVALEKHVCWTVRDFVLIRSLQGEGEHEHLCYWPLLG
jgi:RNA 2',3'-cyclic 3'-phosphodiesterase